jgi:hypothetical protein
MEIQLLGLVMVVFVSGIMVVMVRKKTLDDIEKRNASEAKMTGSQKVEESQKPLTTKASTQLNDNRPSENIVSNSTVENPPPLAAASISKSKKNPVKKGGNSGYHQLPDNEDEEVAEISGSAESLKAREMAMVDKNERADFI